MSTGQKFRIHRLDSGGLHVGEACTKHWYPIGDVPKTDTLITSVYGFLVQNQSVLELWVCNPATNWRVFSWSRHYNFWHIRGITHRYPNRYPKAMTNLSGKPSGPKSFGLHHENPYLQPLFCQHQMDQVYVCLVSLSMHFIHVVCLTVSLFLFPLSKLMGEYSKASKEEQCGIRRLRSKIQAASRRCRHSTNKWLQKNNHNWIGGGEEPNTGNGR